jgi:hypothetical protein
MNFRDYVAQKLSHLKPGQRISPPIERVTDPLDETISGVIDSLPAANRLYPELYAWVVADAIRDALRTSESAPTSAERSPTS